jgi:hypothetical protein
MPARYKTGANCYSFLLLYILDSGQRVGPDLTFLKVRLGLSRHHQSNVLAVNAQCLSCERALAKSVGSNCANLGATLAERTSRCSYCCLTNRLRALGVLLHNTDQCKRSCASLCGVLECTAIWLVRPGADRCGAIGEGSCRQHVCLQVTPGSHKRL